MRYPTIDDETTMPTHQHGEFPIVTVDVSSIGTTEGLADEFRLAASRIEAKREPLCDPMSDPLAAPKQTTPQQGKNGSISWDLLVNDNLRYSATEDNIASEPLTRPEAMVRNFGPAVVLVAGGLTAICGFIAWRGVYCPISNEAHATFANVARKLDSGTPPVAEHGATATTQTALSADFLKEMQNLREKWTERTTKTVGVLKAYDEIFQMTLTETQADVVLKYRKKFERLHAEAIRHFNALDNGVLDWTSMQIRYQRLRQLNEEWNETAREFARQSREVGLE